VGNEMKISIPKITTVRKGHSHQRPKTWATKDRDPIRDRREVKANLRRTYYG
jgi:hypothetical protein